MPVRPLTPHPAKFSDAVAGRIAAVLAAYQPGLVLDPFAGVGGIHHLAPGAYTVGVEIEPEWATQADGTIVADALHLPFPDRCFDAVATSPSYGSRMADHHDARDGSKRVTYRHTLGRPLHDANSGAMQWGDTYRAFHAAAWHETRRVLTRPGLFILSVSNHIRAGREQLVAEWHLGWWLGHDAKLLRAYPVDTPRLRYGANANLRADHEWVFALQLPEDHPHAQPRRSAQAQAPRRQRRERVEQLADRARLADPVDP